MQVAHGGALDANGGVDPGCVARLRREGGVGEVVRARVADGAVDHGDLAVVAQIDAAGGEAQLRRECGHELDPACSQLSAQGRVQEPCRADRIHEQATAHAAADRAHQGLCDPAAARVGHEDVIEEVAVVTRPVDVGYQGVDHPLGLGDELEVVATVRCGLADVVGEVRQGPVLKFELGGCLALPVLRARCANALDDVPMPPQTLFTEVHFTEDEEGEHAGHRDHEDHEDPGEGGGVALLRPQEDRAREEDLRGDEAQDEERPADLLVELEGR